MSPQTTPLFSWTLRTYSYEKWSLDVKPWKLERGWTLKRICHLFKWWLFFLCYCSTLFSRFLNIFHVSSCVARGRWGRMFHGWRDPTGSGNSPRTFGDFIHPRQWKRFECARVTHHSCLSCEYVILKPPSNPKNGIFRLETLWNPMNQERHMFFGDVLSLSSNLFAGNSQHFLTNPRATLLRTAILTWNIPFMRKDEKGSWLIICSAHPQVFNWLWQAHP